MSTKLYSLSPEKISEAAAAVTELADILKNPNSLDLNKARRLQLLADDLRLAADNFVKSSAWWKDVNWEDSDSMIAHELGVTREAVRVRRRTLGKPPAVFFNRPKQNAVIRYLQSRAMVPSTAEVCAATGVSPHTARAVAKEHGMELRNSSRKYDWESVDWENLRNSEIGRALGMPKTFGSSGAVARMRSKYAPHTVGKMRGSKAKYDWDSVDWESMRNVDIIRALRMPPKSGPFVSMKRRLLAPHTMQRKA